MINLGDEVKDTVTDFKGVAIAKCFYLNGCVRFAIQPKVKKDGTLPDDCWMDIEQLEVTRKAKTKKSKPTGGPQNYIPTRSSTPKR